MNETENDVITLSGCKRITKWRFPAKMKHCPVTKCHKSFQSRQSAIAHYTKIHAPNSFYCSICEKPLALQNVTNLLLHFRNRHPGKKIPPKENQTRYKQAIQTKGVQELKLNRIFDFEPKLNAYFLSLSSLDKESCDNPKKQSKRESGQ